MDGRGRIKVFSFLEQNNSLKKEWMLQDFGKNIHFSYIDFKLKNFSTNEWVSPIIAYSYLDKSNNSVCKVMTFNKGKKITIKMYQQSYHKKELPYIAVSESFYSEPSNIQKMMIESMAGLIQDAVAFTFYSSFRLEEAMRFKPRIIYASLYSMQNGDFNNSIEENLEFFE
jgi:hypothetical protein